MPRRRTTPTPESARRDFALRLKSARITAGYTSAKDAAKALNMPEAETYRRWERGETEPGIYHLGKIVEAFKCSEAFLLTGKSNGLATGEQHQPSSATPR